MVFSRFRQERDESRKPDYDYGFKTIAGEVFLHDIYDGEEGYYNLRNLICIRSEPDLEGITLFDFVGDVQVVVPVPIETVLAKMPVGNQEGVIE